MSPPRPAPGPVLGLRANAAPFAVLVTVNALVGGMLGQERTVLPLLASEVFGLTSYTAALTYILAFGLAKAVTNYLAGTWSERYGRKPVLVAGWLVAVPVPLLLIVAPDWWVVVLANVLLGISQGLTWSTTVIMKIDLVGPRRRGLAMGLNESAGYLALALTALLTGSVAARYGLRPEPFLIGIAYAALGLGLSTVAVRETRSYAEHEAAAYAEPPRPAGRPSGGPVSGGPVSGGPVSGGPVSGGPVSGGPLSGGPLSGGPLSGGPLSGGSVSGGPVSGGKPLDRQVSDRQVFLLTSMREPALSSAAQAGLVNNLNDGLAWGIFPVLFTAAGLSLDRTGILVALYPAVWGVGQLVTGALSDRWGRKPLITTGMLLQTLALAQVAASESFVPWAAATVLLGIGTAMVYPALLACVGDAAHPSWRARAVGVYRFWRDLGFAVGAVLTGVLADAFGLRPAIWAVAALTAASGLVVAVRMYETRAR